MRDAPQVRYRPMRADDLPFAVEQHQLHFPDGFFARLGRGFLTEYYRAFLTGPDARTSVAEADGRLVGYLVGVTDPAAHRRHVVQQHGRPLVVKGVLAMLGRPWLAVRFLRTRSRLYSRKLMPRRAAADVRTGSAGQPSTTAVLTHVAVAPDAQSAGIGSALIQRFDDQVHAAGGEQLTLVTASGSDGAGPYYEHRGWRVDGERCTPDGLQLTTYTRPVQASEDRSPAQRSDESA